MMPTPSVNASTAAQLAFYLRGEQPERVAVLLKDLLPKIYAHVRRTRSHDEAAEFTARFADAVIANLHSDPGHG